MIFQRSPQIKSGKVIVGFVFALALRPKLLYLGHSWAAEVVLKADGFCWMARRITLRAKVVGSPLDSLEPEDYLTNSFRVVAVIAIKIKLREISGRAFNALRNS